MQLGSWTISRSIEVGVVKRIQGIPPVFLTPGAHCFSPFLNVGGRGQHSGIALLQLGYLIWQRQEIFAGVSKVSCWHELIILGRHDLIRWAPETVFQVRDPPTATPWEGHMSGTWEQPLAVESNPQAGPSMLSQGIELWQQLQWIRKRMPSLRWDPRSADPLISAWGTLSCTLTQGNSEVINWYSWKLPENKYDGEGTALLCWGWGYWQQKRGGGAGSWFFSRAQVSHPSSLFPLPPTDTELLKLLRSIMINEMILLNASA